MRIILYHELLMGNNFVLSLRVLLKSLQSMHLIFIHVRHLHARDVPVINQILAMNIISLLCSNLTLKLPNPNISLLGPGAHPVGTCKTSAMAVYI